MKILVVGGGPAGLYFAYLMRRHRPDAEIHVVEQNRADSTFGFGVVFSDRALDFLREDDPETYELVTPAMEMWADLRVVHRGQRLRIDGIGFAAIDRLELLRFLQRRLFESGCRAEFGRAVSSRPELEGYDLVVGADGVNSFVRSCYAKLFGTTVAYLRNKFAWYGTTQVFDCLTQTFVESDAGTFNAHHYRHAPAMSTFVVECGPETWERAGFAAMDDPATIVYCERVFAETLEGRPLLSNRSIWRNFPVVENERWWVDNLVLIGDALHTAHFSVGSGTRLAMEDARALAASLSDHSSDVREALAAFEDRRRPVVDKLVAAARASGQWYEHFPEHMRLPPWPFAMSYIQRSGRIAWERLQKSSPAFARGYKAAVASGEADPPPLARRGQAPN